MEPSWAFYQSALEELYQVDANVRNVLRAARYVLEEWKREQREKVASRPDLTRPPRILRILP